MMHLRPATKKDVDLLRHWDKQPHVAAAVSNDDWQWETDLEINYGWREQLIAEENERPVGFLQIIDPAREISQYWGSIDSGYRAIDIWIGEQSDLGKGYGTEMMNLALKRIFSDETVMAVLLDPLASNTKAHRFYNRLNFKFVGERMFDLDLCFIFKLTRSDWLNANDQD
ncbi:MAG: GNAT family N-acetyltransferase [Saprospiraceae bacterium]|nr:GNAT family N-acetyltransferase [Saprospiraceae bacterium]